MRAKRTLANILSGPKSSRRLFSPDVTDDIHFVTQHQHTLLQQALLASKLPNAGQEPPYALGRDSSSLTSSALDQKMQLADKHRGVIKGVHQ